MKRLASVAAVVCVTVIVALAAPRAGSPAYQYGLTGNEWWAGLGHTTASVAPASTRTFGYGLTDNDWWAAQARKRTPRAD